jgi:hypothetical protein
MRIGKSLYAAPLHLAGCKNGNGNAIAIGTFVVIPFTIPHCLIVVIIDMHLRRMILDG